MKNSTTISKISLYGIGILFLFLGWIVLSTIMNNDLVYPTIDKVFISFFTLLTDVNVLIAFGCSLLRVLMVVIISLLISFVISFIYITYKDSILLFKPLLTFIKATPLAIISVYLWISLGSSNAPYIITLLMILPVMIEGFISALDNIDEAYILQLKTEDISIFRKFIKVYIPLILPYIIMTILQTFGLGLKVMLMGEYICQTSNSLGNYIYIFKQSLEFNNLLGMAIYVVIIVCILEFVIKKISKTLNN